jgi:hypothetical protein
MVEQLFTTKSERTGETVEQLFNARREEQGKIESEKWRWGERRENDETEILWLQLVPLHPTLKRLPYLEYKIWFTRLPGGCNCLP